MRKLTRILLTLTALVPMFCLTATAEKRESVEIVKPAQAVDFTQSIDVSGWDRFSVQATYADGSPSTATLITSGSKSVSTITVVNPYAGIAKRANVQITISSYGTTGILTGAVITLNGKTFTQGFDWAIGASSGATAKNISDAIAATTNFRSTYTSSPNAVVIASAAVAGTLSNGWTATVSTVALTLSANTFTQGEDVGSIVVGTNTFVQGVDWIAGRTSSDTAKAIADAFDARFSSIFKSTWSAAGIVTSTAVTNGDFNYFINASSGLTPQGFTNGSASDISLSADTITKASHGWTTGLAVLFSTTAPNVPPAPLISRTTYYVIKSDNDRFKLSDTSTGSVAGISLDLTSLPLLIASTYTFTPLVLVTSAGNGFYWSGGNDGVNFSTLTATTANIYTTNLISSVTYSGAGSSIWDFGQYAYKYLRINFKAPTSGGIALTVKIYGKKD